MPIKEKLPPFETANLSKFVFGDPEAKSDVILPNCFQRIRGVEEFLNGSKNIVLGERGAGKSALFKLVSDGTLAFTNEAKEKVRKLLIVPIDDDLDYLAIANVIEERFSDNSKRRHGKYRYLWEIYILSRIIDSLQAEYPDDLEIKTLREDFGEVLGLPKETAFRIKDLFTNYKLTLGGKMDPSGAVTPSVSIEPAKDAKQLPAFITDREIGLHRERLRKALRTRSTVAIVLVDRVDDFVVGLAYDEQLKNIQALVDCIKDFRLPEMKLKVFLRTDLFNRISFAHGGYDKLAPQITRLAWTSKDICEFVARRLIYNYKNLGLRVQCSQIDLSLLDIDPSFSEQLRSVLKVEVNGVGDLVKALYRLVLTVSRIKIAKLRRKSHSARKTDLIHAVVIRTITLLFPTKIQHLNSQCQPEEISVEDFFATHFKLGGENPNPRLVLLFLGFVFEFASHYYSRNPDTTSIEANELNEYELILHEHIRSAYKKLQETARKTVAHLSPERRKYVERLFANADCPGKCRTLAFEQLRLFSGWDLTDEEFHSFVALFTHIGLLVPDNPTLTFEDRTYSFPVLMTRCAE